LRGEHLDLIFQQLHEGPKTAPEIAEATGISERTVRRILSDYLKRRWKIADKREDNRWTLFSYEQTYESYDHYEFMLRHSEKLIPGLEALTFRVKGGYREVLLTTLGKGRPGKTVSFTAEDLREMGVETYSDDAIIPGKEERDLMVLFFEHLMTGYPGIIGLMKEHDKLSDARNTMERKLVEALTGRLPDGAYDRIKSTGTGPDILPGDLDPKALFALRLLRNAKRYLRFDPEAGELPLRYRWGWLRLGSMRLKMNRGLAQSVIDAFRDKGLIEGLRLLNQIDDGIEEVKRRTVEGLEHLKLLVRSGKPLKGTCMACRDIKVGTENSTL